MFFIYFYMLLNALYYIDMLLNALNSIVLNKSIEISNITLSILELMTYILILSSLYVARYSLIKYTSNEMTYMILASNKMISMILISNEMTYMILVSMSCTLILRTYDLSSLCHRYLIHLSSFVVYPIVI